MMLSFKLLLRIVLCKLQNLIVKYKEDKTADVIIASTDKEVPEVDSNDELPVIIIKSLAVIVGLIIAYKIIMTIFPVILILGELYYAFIITRKLYTNEVATSYWTVYKLNNERSWFCNLELD